MKDYINLPSGYKEVFKIDLLNNRKMFVIVNVINTVIAAIMFVAGLFFQPEGADFKLIHAIVMSIGMWVYIILHELVHGIFMKKFSGQKPKYGWKVIYAYAGSDAYFCKSHYMIIAMAPVVVWGIVLGILNLFVSPGWFWTVYAIQILNISGAAGDFYVTYLMTKMPEDTLTQDTGTDMTLYSAKEISI